MDRSVADHEKRNAVHGRRPGSRRGLWQHSHLEHEGSEIQRAAGGNPVRSRYRKVLPHVRGANDGADAGSVRRCAGAYECFWLARKTAPAQDASVGEKANCAVTLTMTPLPLPAPVVRGARTAYNN